MVAILPLVRRYYRGVRLLEWIGARAADYCDVLVHPEVDSDQALQLLWQVIVRPGDCDLMRLGQIREDARMQRLLAAGRLMSWMETREQTYFLPIRWHLSAFRSEQDVTAMQSVDLLRGVHQFKLHYRPQLAGLQTCVVACSLIGQAYLAAYRLLRLRRARSWSRSASSYAERNPGHSKIGASLRRGQCTRKES